MLSSYPEQHTLFHAAHQKSESLQHKNTHSCPLCSYTPEDMCRTPHIHSHLFPKTEDMYKMRKNMNWMEKLPLYQCLNGLSSWLTISCYFTFTGVFLCGSGLVARPAWTEDASLRQVGTVVFTDVVTACVPTAMVWQEQIYKTLDVRLDTNCIVPTVCTVFPF